jgi:cytochrome P450
MQVRTNNAFFNYLDRAKAIFKDQSAMHRGRVDFINLVHDRIARKLEKGSDARPDFVGYIIKNQEVQEKALTRDEMDSNAILFLAAGSETTATTLSGDTYLLLSNPQKYAALVSEIRNKFSSASEITIEEVNTLDYMTACLKEGLRYYPPIPTGFPRVVPASGDHISSHFVPKGTSVYVAHYAANRSTRNYKDLKVFTPER